MKRLVLCTGKVGYELMEARDKAGDKNTTWSASSSSIPSRASRWLAAEGDDQPRRGGLVPGGAARTRAIGTSSKARSRNAWPRPGARPKRPLYAGRKASASPATGLAKRHAAEQAELIADALGHSERALAHRKAELKGRRMATEVKVPALGESITEATLGAMAQAARRRGRGRRADRQPRDRQGRDRGALAGRRRRWASSASRSATRSRSAR